MSHTLVVLATDPTISAFGYHLTLTKTLLIYLAIAAIIGFIAETVVGWRLPFGIIGAILASLLGIWLLTNVFPVTITGDDFVILGEHIPLIKTALGAFLVVALWHLITYPAWGQRHRYYRGYRETHRRYRRSNY